MARRLVLWDIDGTLVRGGEAAALAFEEAIEVVVGVRPQRRPVMSGRTDPDIATEYLTALGFDAERYLGDVLAELEARLSASAARLSAEGSPCPGAAAVLEALAARPEICQSVLSGNIAPNARLKLAAFGLDRYLDLECGAFGSDDAERERLVGIALARQWERRGRRFSAKETWIVGDSPRDLACARAAAQVVLVATGRHDLDELGALGPDGLFADLSDAKAVLARLAPQ